MQLLKVRLEKSLLIVNVFSKESVIWNTCWQSVITLYWKSLSLWFQLYYYLSEFSQLSLLHTFIFASVAFNFVVIIFSYFHFKKCHFQFLFTLACVTFIFFSFFKCHFHFSSISQVFLSMLLFLHVLHFDILLEEGPMKYSTLFDLICHNNMYYTLPYSLAHFQAVFNTCFPTCIQSVTKLQLSVALGNKCFSLVI